MRKPLTVADAQAKGLLVEKGIHTFSNGTEWECWADSNCMECRWYDWDAMGLCAFESAAMLRSVSPALAVLFGWKERAAYPGSYEPPETCAFFAAQGDDNGGDRPTPPAPVDPRQLVLIADPTEDAATITNAPVEVLAHTASGEG